MARNVNEKKKRIAHWSYGEGSEVSAGCTDYASSLLQKMDDKFSFSSLVNIAKSKAPTQKRQQNVSNSLPATLKPLKGGSGPKSRKLISAPLMEKSQKTLKLIQHNRKMPKPRAHLASLTDSNLQDNSVDNNHERSKKNKKKESNKPQTFTKSKSKNVGEKSQHRVNRLNEPRPSSRTREEKHEKIAKSNTSHAVGKSVSSSRANDISDPLLSSSDTDSDYEQFIKRNTVTKKSNTSKRKRNAKKIESSVDSCESDSDSSMETVKKCTSKNKRSTLKKNTKKVESPVQSSDFDSSTESFEKSKASMKKRKLRKGSKKDVKKVKIQNTAKLCESDSDHSCEQSNSKVVKKNAKVIKTPSVPGSDTDTSYEDSASQPPVSKRAKVCRKNTVSDVPNKSVGNSKFVKTQCASGSDTDTGYEDFSPEPPSCKPATVCHKNTVGELPNTSVGNLIPSENLGSKVCNANIDYNNGPDIERHYETFILDSSSGDETDNIAELERPHDNRIIAQEQRKDNTASEMNSLLESYNKPKINNSMNCELTSEACSSAMYFAAPTNSAKQIQIEVASAVNSSAMPDNSPDYIPFDEFIKLKSESTNTIKEVSHCPNDSFVVDLTESDVECENEISVAAASTKTCKEPQDVQKPNVNESDEEFELEILDVVLPKTPPKKSRNVSNNQHAISEEIKIEKGACSSENKTQDIQQPKPLQKESVKHEAMYTTNICEKYQMLNTTVDVLPDTKATPVNVNNGESNAIRIQMTEPVDDDIIILDDDDKPTSIICRDISSHEDSKLNTNVHSSEINSTVSKIKETLKSIPSTSGSILPQIQTSNDSDDRIEDLFANVIKLAIKPLVTDNSATAGEIAMLGKGLKLNNVASSNQERMLAFQEHINNSDLTGAKSLVNAILTELKTYEKIVQAEETLEAAFQLLESQQAEKVLWLRSMMNKYMESSSCSDSSPKQAKTLLDGPSILPPSRNANVECPQIGSSSSTVCKQEQADPHTAFIVENLVPLSSIDERDIKPDVGELQSTQRSNTNQMVC